MKKTLSGIALFLLIVTAKQLSASENIVVKGDFRYRHEMIDQEDKDYTRNRQRIRARLEVAAKLNDTWSAGFRFASGSDDPVSTNQTLTGGFSTKPLALDLAYFKWSPNQILTVQGGKTKLPFQKVGKTELLWDGDLNPEGLSFVLNKKMGSLAATLSSAMLWVEEKKTEDDVILYGAQGGLGSKLNDDIKIWAGVGYYTLTGAEGSMPVFDGDSFGNSVDENGYYLTGFDEVEVSAELSSKIGELPVSVVGDYVTNTAADENNMGWLVGFSAGKAKDPGSMAFAYSYRKLEQDAVIGAFTDSDFIGGGTDGSGHEFGFGYMINKQVKAEASFFLNKIGVENGKDFKRLMLDVSMKLN